MTVALIALFMSLAVCALIGWAFICVLGIVARGLRRHARPPSRSANEPTIVLSATAQEMAERARIKGEPQRSGNVETYLEGGRWKNKVQGNSRASNVHETRAAAVRAGREMARKRRVEHIVKKKDGTIGERNSVESNSRSVPG